MYLGVAVLDPKSSGKIGFYSVTYYMGTSVLAAILGNVDRFFYS